MKLFDAHCHLQDKRFTSMLNEMLAAARQAGIAGFACCGTSETDWEKVAQIAGKNDDVHASFGLHPWYAADRSDEWESNLRIRLEQNPASGVGEVGLDHALSTDTWEDQQLVFRIQLELARELNRPVSIHCRRAWGVMLDVLTASVPLPAGFVIHSYSGSKEQIPAIVRLGGYVSFSGSTTLSGNKRAHRNVSVVPLDRLLLETDAPDIPPVINGKRNMDGPNLPENLVHVLHKIADLRNMTERDVAKATWENAERLLLS